MKPNSAIKKGKRLEQKVASLWRSKVDGFAVGTPGSGSGAKHKEDVYNRYFAIECKNKETHSIWQEWEQARGETSFAKPPVLCISGNYRPILVVMDINDWLDLVKEAKLETKRGGDIHD